ncbi:hypothetical protein EWM60_12260 [Candidatus Erwinia dacicola]|nr:hypothetical protein [Candidatus Erwinia dacicola]
MDAYQRFNNLFKDSTTIAGILPHLVLFYAVRRMITITAARVLSEINELIQHLSSGCGGMKASTKLPSPESLSALLHY